MKKYELVGTDKKTPLGKPLFQVVALRDFGDVRKGDKGGYIESTDNLSNEGNCWVSENAFVFDNARVSENAFVFGEAQVFGGAFVHNDAQVYGDSRVFGEAWVFGNAEVFQNAQVCGNVLVYGNSRVFGNAEVYGDAEIYGTTELAGGHVAQKTTATAHNPHPTLKPKTCHGGQTGKFCSECGEKL